MAPLLPTPLEGKGLPRNPEFIFALCAFICNTTHCQEQKTLLPQNFFTWELVQSHRMMQNQSAACQTHLIKATAPECCGVVTSTAARGRRQKKSCRFPSLQFPISVNIGSAPLVCSKLKSATSQSSNKMHNAQFLLFETLLPLPKRTSVHTTQSWKCLSPRADTP